MITSRQNPKIKAARALRQKKARDRERKTLVEGILHVGEAVEAGAAVETIFYAPDLLTSDFAGEILSNAAARGTPQYAVSPEVFASLAEKSGPQGILAVVAREAAPLSSLTPETCPWVIALVAPQDPGNVGTILRTLDAVGAGALALLDGGADPWHPTAVRAAMGATFWKPIVETSSEAFLKWAKAGGYTVAGTSAKGETVEDTGRLSAPVVMLFGSEQKGLSQAHLSACDTVIRLPMRGRGSSLNLAVAAGVIMYLAGPGTPG